MKIYWVKDLKETEKAMYIGHISADDKAYGTAEIINDKIESIKKENDMTGLRFSGLRDLFDEHPCSDGGNWYGTDVWLIVKSGYFKKNRELIKKFKKVFEDGAA